MAVSGEDDGPQCQALNISDSLRCTATATANNNLFCQFHAKQCFGLYIGYKRRNAELDRRAQEEEPAFLRNATVALVNQTFDKVTDEEELKDIHAFLFKQYVLLGNVITARNTHHKHFYSLEMDYGHKLYLDKLVGRRHTIAKALENLERRTAEALYEKEKWFTWVRKVQDDEEDKREKEQKKAKLEAAMFRRHCKEMEARLAAAKAKEEKKRQEAYLEEVWRERMAAKGASEELNEENAAAWDPIEDVVFDDRGKFIDLIRHFLWMEIPPPTETSEDAGGRDGDGDASSAAPKSTGEGADEDDQPEGGKKKSSRKRGGKKKNKAAKKIEQKAPAAAPQKDAAPQPDKSKIESKEDIGKRLREGVERDYSHVEGPMVVGSTMNPYETFKRTAPVPEEEIGDLLAEIKEIKVLLFCRQLLAHSSLLPAALRAQSIEEFLADETVSDADLRDLCLRVEQPSLQALRDACADFGRGDEPETDESDATEEEGGLSTPADYLRYHLRYGKESGIGSLYDEMMSARGKRMLGARKKEIQKLLNLGPKEEKMKVTVCGKTIWNYASERSMARSGWLHFSIMAKDCSFPEAISLCRNWDEFFDLNLLALWQYFPASKWASWCGNLVFEELGQMGFVPFYFKTSAPSDTTSGGFYSRQRGAFQSRNVICANMKRNDPVTRRFIQYALMRAGEILILVRDGCTGKIVVGPDKSQRWLLRQSEVDNPYGGDRSWHNLVEVNEAYFHGCTKVRTFQLGFKEHYEIYIWDFAPGQMHMNLAENIRDLLVRARRVRHPKDKYAHMKPSLESVTRDENTMRVRHIKPGEQVINLYEQMTGLDAKYFLVRSGTMDVGKNMEKAFEEMGPYVFYNDTDEAEDAVLFDEEAQGNWKDMPFVEISNPIHTFETSGMSTRILEALDLQDLELGGENSSGEESAGVTKSKGATRTAGTNDFDYSVPPIWKEVHARIPSYAQRSGGAAVLKRLAFDSLRLETTINELTELSDREIIDRDRSYFFKQTFHMGDLEPNAQERYKDSVTLINGIQKYCSPQPQDDWAWFCIEILDWMNLKMHYEVYNPAPFDPWPHRYIVQDIVQAFLTMAMFFPNLDVTHIAREFLDSKASHLKSSPLFDPASRALTRPDTRTRESHARRPKDFWKVLKRALKTQKPHMGEVGDVPKEWHLYLRPTIAKLYRAGIVAPANIQPHPQVCPGYATANTEPHRPGNLDLFINYDNIEGPIEPPPSYVAYEDWPAVLPAARAWGKKHLGARFAVLRLWSAPHFYPLMLDVENRHGTAFIDTVERTWEWKFVPKDMPLSEWSCHNNMRLRLGFLREQMMSGRGLERAGKSSLQRGAGSAEAKWKHGTCELDDRVVIRGDMVLVMGTDELDLLRWSTAVAFTLQTKPWLREIDLWKSFINVELQFLEDMNPFWLD
ncbi:hypothetical protein GQ53DRAFT_753902 [Thozetella sp. PMI_491]|nr:hypothetical protein GQ53DRAFT_753902 [Thozetella sp. PMI_491]